MKNGLARFYKMWNSGAGDNYYIFDRNTGEKIDSVMMFDKALEKLKELNNKDRQERGLGPSNEIETSTTYFSNRNREDHEVAPMPIYK